MNNYGLNNDYEYMELELDSLDATGAAQYGSAKTDWPMFFVAGKGPVDNMVALKIMEVSVPVSWYVFNSVNNTFILTEMVGVTPVDATVTLPIGNWNLVELAANMVTALDAVSPNGWTYTVTYDRHLGKYTFSNGQTMVSSPFTFRFGAGEGEFAGVPANSGNKNPRLWIGFTPGITSSTVTTLGDTIVAPNYQMIGGPAYLYLNSRTLGSNTDVYLPEGAINLSGGKAGPQIAKIAVQANADGWVHWVDPDPQKYFPFNTNNTINSMDFYLTLGNTTSQNPLQLNGLGFSIKVAILTKKISNQGSGETAYNGRIFDKQKFNSNR